jgi:plastocyanin
MKLYLSHAAASALCGVLGMLTFAAVTHAPVGASATAHEAAVTVTMSDTRFGPGTVHVQRGGTVTWSNTSQMVHTVSGAGFDSGNIAAGATFSRTFDRAGTYDYHCKPHKAAGMVGRVIVDP